MLREKLTHDGQRLTTVNDRNIEDDDEKNRCTLFDMRVFVLPRP